jgi:hypothetical protein
MKNAYAIDKIIDMFNEIIINSSLHERESLTSSKVLNYKEHKSHYSILFVNTVIMRILQNKLRLEINPIYKKIFDISKTDSNGWLIIDLHTLDDFFQYSDNFVKILDSELNKNHGDRFDCCSNYLECSKDKACVKNDFMFSLQCYYRTNIRQNKVFY